MREPNEVIIQERHVTPTIDDVILELNGSSHFSKLDLNKGYHQLELAPESRYITTFSANQKQWRYKRLMFGLRSAAEVFQNVPIRTTFQGIPKTLNISDDILVHGSSQEEHDENLRKVFARAREVNLTFNRNKCEFNKRHLSFFGHVWSPEGVSADPKKLEAIRNLKTPENPDELRSLLGMASYVSRIIPNFATVTEPLRRLTRVNTPWEWGTEQKKALEELHSLLQSNTTKAYYNPAKHPELVVDASPVGLGAILAQKDNKEDQGGKIVAYASRALTDVETRYSQTERSPRCSLGCREISPVCLRKTDRDIHRPQATGRFIQQP